MRSAYEISAVQREEVTCIELVAIGEESIRVCGPIRFTFVASLNFQLLPSPYVVKARFITGIAEPMRLKPFCVVYVRKATRPVLDC